MNLNFEIYAVGQNRPAGADALIDSLKDLDRDKSYADMMRLRASGDAAHQCNDIYYLCTDEHNRLISRLWMGWGRHGRAVGNWGNFLTDPSFRGQGIGKRLLDMWVEDVKDRADLPLALFCTAGSEKLAKMYAPYGFRCAIKDTHFGPLYCPLGNSPETFDEFCRDYYKPASALIFKPATLEWRHEIDCLFKFAMLALGLDYLPQGVESLEKALLDHDTSVEIIFTDTGTPVGIARIKDDGQKDIRIYPSYLHLI